MEKISIVVPIYNAEQYISSCIESLCNQTYSNIEIVLVDDGSTDRSGKICDEYASKDSRIKVIHKVNGGVSSTRNAGIDNAEGEYIMFVDSDDEICEDCVSSNLTLAKENDADLVIYGFLYNAIDEGSCHNNGFDQDYILSEAEFFDGFYCDIVEREFINPPWNKLIRKTLLTENKIRFNENYSICEDMAFSTEVVAASKKIVLNHEICYKYNIKLTGSLVFKFHENYFEALTNFYDLSLAYCNRYMNQTKQRKCIDSIYSSLAIMYIKQICCNDKWEKKDKMVKLKSILKDTKFLSALQNAELNRKKTIVRFLIHRKQYQCIYIMYRILAKKEKS